MEKYEWRCPGLYKVPADIAAQEVKNCEDKDGFVHPSAVVNRSEPPSAVLHGCFEWQDDIAAVKWREQQARVLIKNIVTVEIRDDDRSEVVKTFVHVISDDSSKGYKQTAIAVRDASDRLYILRAARRELENFRSKYSKLTEFAGLMASIEEAINTLGATEGGGS